MTEAQDHAAWPSVTAVVPTRGRPELVRLAVRGGRRAALRRRHRLRGRARPGGARRLAHRAEPGRPQRAGASATTATPASRARATAVSGRSRRPSSPPATTTTAGCRTRCACRSSDCSATPRCTSSARASACSCRRTASWSGSGLGRRHAERPAPSRRKELHSSTLLMRTEVFDRVGGYDVALPQSYAEDYEWLLRASRLGPIGVVRQPLANIKKDGTSWFRERAEVVAEALQHLLDTHPELTASRAATPASWARSPSPTRASAAARRRCAGHELPSPAGRSPLRHTSPWCRWPPVPTPGRCCARPAS